MKKIIAFGEVLFDALPSGKVLGGAPLNVIARLSAFGVNCGIISRVGNDADGKIIKQQISDLKINSFIQTDEALATSLVNVVLDKKGVATYDIVYPCAWDAIFLNEKLIQEVSQADVFIYGSLVSRDERSYATLKSLLNIAKVKVFDVNLRAPHYNVKRVFDLMNNADLIKLNDDEALLLTESQNLQDALQKLHELSGVKDICITRGADGALLDLNGNVQDHTGYKVKVADTVGAGDNFLAGLIYQLFITKEENILDFACALGALAASKTGATPNITHQDVLDFIAIQKNGG